MAENYTASVDNLDNNDDTTNEGICKDNEDQTKTNYIIFIGFDSKVT